MSLLRTHRKRNDEEKRIAYRLEGWMIAKGFCFSSEGESFAEKGAVSIAYSFYSDEITIGTSIGIYEDGKLSQLKICQDCLVLNGKKFFL